MIRKNQPITAAVPGKARSGGSFLSRLGWIAAAAFLLRLIASWEMSRANGGINNVMTPVSASDLRTYMTLAAGIARGHLPAEFYYQPYYYTIFLPLFYWLFPATAVWCVIAAQAFLGGAAVFLTGVCAKKIHSERAGVIAALFAAVSVPLILYTPFHQNETLQSFHLILLLYLTLCMAKKPSWLLWSAGGLTASVSILTRGNVWFLLPAVFLLPLVMLIRSKNPPRSVALCVLLFLLFLLLPMLPFSLKNSFSRGKWCGPSTAADAVLALGNSPEAPAGGREPGLPAGPMDYPEAFHRMMKLSSQGCSVPRQMFRWFCGEPAAFCELQWRKLLLFWDGREIPNNVSLEYDGFTSFLLRWDLIGRTAFLLPFSVAGIFFFLGLLKKKHPGNWVILYAFAGSFYLAAAAFYLLSRFRAPILPVLFIFAGAFIAEAVMRLHQAGQGRMALFLRFFLFLLAGAFLVWQAYDTYRAMEPAVMRLVRPRGTRLHAQGMPDVSFDHGPEPFGGWLLFPLSPGMSCAKRFAGCGGKTGELSFAVLTEKGGELSLRIQGKTILYSLPGEPGRHRLTLPVTLDETGMCRIEFLRLPADCFLILDSQRAYGRSFAGEKTLPGEFVWRFYH